MPRDPRYDTLFEPVEIGPVTTKNRFYQVPHCSGTSDNAPDANTRMREIKAEGGWGVVCTEIAEVANTTEFWPFPSLHLWDDSHVARIAAMPEAVHRHGALAGVELGHVGLAAGNRAIRIPPLGPSSHLTLESVEPFQCKAMDKADIRLLRWQHRAAARRAMQAGFDIVYCYAGHGLSIFSQFLQTRYNQRTDEYGGSLENRTRLLREVLEEMKEEIGDDCAVALRFAVNEVDGDLDAGRAVVEALKDLPDLWDVNLSDWSEDSATSRFAKEGFQEKFVSFVKQVTDKPVVSVGRFTSPDAMLSQVKRGICDLVGAARPSIADPFLPRKIDEGRVDEIRRVHRLQHLRLGRAVVLADAMHPEPHHDGGASTRLAPGEGSREGLRRCCPGGGCPALPASNALTFSRAAAIPSPWPTRKMRWAAGCCVRRACPASPSGAGSPTIACMPSDSSGT